MAHLSTLIRLILNYSFTLNILINNYKFNKWYIQYTTDNLPRLRIKYMNIVNVALFPKTSSVTIPIQSLYIVMCSRFWLLGDALEDSITCVDVLWEMNDQVCIYKMFYAAWNSLHLILTSKNLNLLSPTFTVWTIIFFCLSVCLNVFFIICNSSGGKVMFLQAWRGTCMCGGGGRVHGYLVSLMMSWWQSRSCFKKQTFPLQSELFEIQLICVKINTTSIEPHFRQEMLTL